MKLSFLSFFTSIVPKMGIFYKYLLSYPSVKMAECAEKLIRGYRNKF